MRFADPFYRMDQFASLQVIDHHGLVFFRSGEQPVGFQINAEVIEIPFDVGGQLERLDKFERGRLLTARIDRE